MLNNSQFLGKRTEVLFYTTAVIHFLSALFHCLGCLIRRQNPKLQLFFPPQIERSCTPLCLPMPTTCSQPVCVKFLSCIAAVVCCASLINIMLISARKAQCQWVGGLILWHRCNIPFGCWSLTRLETTLQLSPVLIKAQQCDWEAILAPGCIFPPEVVQSFRADLQTHCRCTTD